MADATKTLTLTASQLIKSYGKNDLSNDVGSAIDSYAYVGRYNNRYRITFRFPKPAFEFTSPCVIKIQLSYYVRSMSGTPSSNFYAALSDKSPLELAAGETRNQFFSSIEINNSYSPLGTVMTTDSAPVAKNLSSHTTGATNTVSLSAGIFNSFLVAASKADYTNDYFYLTMGAYSTWETNNYIRIDATPRPTLILTYTQGLVNYYDNGKWVQCIPHYYENGTWKQCIPHYYINNTWQIVS